MTMPDDVDAGAPNNVAAQATAKALVDNKARLGLTWDLRPALVLNTDPSSGRISVQVDGDDAAISAESMVGQVSNGARVFVIIIPPSGIFVVGFVGAFSRPGEAIGSAYWTDGLAAGSNTGLEITLNAWTSFTPFVIGGRRVAQLTLSTGIESNSALVSGNVVRVREIIGSTASTQLLAGQFIVPAGVANIPPSTVFVSYIQNTRTEPFSFNPGVTNQRSVGAGTNFMYGDVNLPISLVGVDIGDINSPELAGIIGLAVAL